MRVYGKRLLQINVNVVKRGTWSDACIDLKEKKEGKNNNNNKNLNEIDILTHFYF